MSNKTNKLLVVEPFYGGSHKQMLTTLLKGIPSDNFTLITMTAKKWHWRARSSALKIWTQLPKDLYNYKTLFCSSVLSLSELVGMCPELNKLKKVIYFHENQLIYPKQIIKDRDYQYGYNQICSCIAADIVLFNSQFNLDSFLVNINKFLKIMPDNVPKNISDKIKPKTRVLYYPIDFSRIDEIRSLKHEDNVYTSKRLCIAWPHRWEFDKNPKFFFDVMNDLKKSGVDFEIVVMGESYSEVPDEIQEAKRALVGHIKHFGYVESVDLYYQLLMSSDIVLSTTDHEFFGVSMLEGVRLGCVPLVPDKLVYPEIYPESCRYGSRDQLFNMLKKFCSDIESFVAFKNNFNLDTTHYDAVNLVPKFMNILYS